MSNGDNPPYVTVMKGVGVYFAVLMVWHEGRDEQGYRIERTGKQHQLLIKAELDAETMADGKLEIRRIAEGLRG